MSHPYPVLGNRPIDQWKVIELREELKRRKLTTRGLKDHLIKRLAEAIRIERENAEAPYIERENDEKTVDNDVDCVTHPAVRGKVDETVTNLAETAKSVLDRDIIKIVEADNVAVKVDINDSLVTLDHEDSKPLPEDDVTKPKDECLESKREFVIPDTSAPDNQVSKVSPTFGCQVKSDSISTDTVSTIEKIELKDDIIAENVKLELDVKSEMVEPSSSNVRPVGCESHPMDVDGVDMNKKNDTSDAGYPEKLSLDRSSGDDSMEEDVLETKQIDSKYNSDDVRDGNKKTETPLVNEETLVDVVGDDLHPNKEMHVESKNRTAAPLQNEENTLVMPAEKRKLNDQAAAGSSEPLKRQRRWNTESVKVSKSQSFNLTSTEPKESFQSTAFKRSLSISDSRNREDEPKERVVPPSQKTPTNSLRIDRFLRPFTLKAVQELLSRTGSFSRFWRPDQDPLLCYFEEAVETRNAVYNLQWPPYGGRLLVAEFVDPQEVKRRADAPLDPAAPVNPSPTATSAPPVVAQSQPLQLPPPPLDPPNVSLDDLFRKTIATPRIYYLPLSEEQVAAKLEARGDRELQG